MIRLFITLMIGAGALMAQPQETAQPQQQQIKITQKEIAQLARTVIRVETLQRDFRQRLKKAQDEKVSEAEQKKMHKDFQSQALKIIESEGMSVPRYGQFMQLAQQNKEFKNALIQAIQQIAAQANQS